MSGGRQAGAGETVVAFEGVTKRLGGRTVLDGLTFSVRAGEIFAVVGPSGTGKSVTLKHIVGLLEPDEGRVTCTSQRIGYLFQSGALLAWLTVYENVALPLAETTRLTDAEIDARVTEALRAVGLEDAADLYPAEISGGMQKRAGLARVLVRDADVILYDEPTSGLDPVTSASISQLVRKVRDASGATSVLVTHDLAGTLRLADRIMLLKDGKCVLCATPEEFSASREPAVVEFLAASRGEGT
ncbi:MAG: ATP-binding cassette domain-containing protein [Kiritimatiellae bacterium]|nr:ATP-binding cassette domain-containing protein [Kiritimatiellia bacterium]MBQ3345284.1 ATP-binding cassette domain-containing protein [Kiritimatiellia bacterium]MBQ6329251.1 ATP-binding cassette domain-containing protein [Kiritimatiellia bacterium]